MSQTSRHPVVGMVAASLLALAAGGSAAWADKTTLGIEWETSAGIDMNAATDVRGNKDPIYKFTDAKDNKEEIHTRILCSTAQTSGGYPLVSLTFDMNWY